jgi:formylglycine-generating enzyme required for sulfatase activity
VPKAVGETQGIVGTQWWRKVDGANWRDIHGPGTESAWDLTHPVVQVSWNDTVAFADWCGVRLPTEVYWEHAARGGLGDVRFPWCDDEPDDESFFPCNIRQGWFPDVNMQKDGCISTAPAQSF